VACFIVQNAAQEAVTSINSCHVCFRFFLLVTSLLRCCSQTTKLTLSNSVGFSAFVELCTTHLLAVCLWFCLLWTLHIKGIIGRVTFCVWLLFLRFSSVALRVRMLFPFYGWIIVYYVDRPHVYAFISWWIFGSFLLTIVDGEHVCFHFSWLHIKREAAGSQGSSVFNSVWSSWPLSHSRTILHPVLTTAPYCLPF
jgi:hypothetical protein